MNRRRPREEPSLDERRALKEAILSGESTMGKSIRALRKQIGLTQPQFAELVGVYPRVLQEVENDKGNPTTETLNKVLNKFGFEIGIVQKRSRT